MSISICGSHGDDVAVAVGMVMVDCVYEVEEEVEVVEEEGLHLALHILRRRKVGNVAIAIIIYGGDLFVN
jgi:hypothetical protein